MGLTSRVAALLVILVAILVSNAVAEQYDANPFLIKLDVPSVLNPEVSAGGIVTSDLDVDGAMDYLVTMPGCIAAYAHDGKKLWVSKVDVRVGGSSERVGLPGHHGPGIQAIDIDGEGTVEVLYLTQDSVLHVVNGADGKEKWSVSPPVPDGAERWEHLIVANLRGKGYRDLLLQATNEKGYRTGRYVAAYSLNALKNGKTVPLWKRDDFVSCAHNGARIADLDGDGRHEVLGPTTLGPDGKLLFKFPIRGHIDSIFAADVRPDIDGIELVALEEGGKNGNRVFLAGTGGLIWETHYKHTEPQNAAIGEFDRDRPGLEIWCRSRYNEHQKPFIFDSRGKLIRQYEMDDVAPKGWTDSGVEVIYSIEWTGSRPMAAAKERHTSGDICVFDPVSGDFVERFTDKADRFYVADVSGDWREEMVVLADTELHIYHCSKPNQTLKRPRLWSISHYRDSKMTYNYYSP